jgi:molybdate transport system permease protein
MLLFVLPVVGILIETPWRELPALLSSDMVVSALRLSLVSSLSATGLSVVFGVPVAYVLARSTFPLKSVVRSVVLLPLVLPPVVGGAALLLALGRRGLLGEPVYTATGFVLPFSMWGVIAATTFVAMPFLIITVEAALRNLDGRLEGAAGSLGAGSWTILRRVTLPLIYPALLSGVALTWARAFGEFGATITFAGNLQGRTQTLPLAVFVALESDRPTAIAISLLMMVISMTVLIALRDRWWPST